MNKFLHLVSIIVLLGCAATSFAQTTNAESNDAPKAALSCATLKQTIEDRLQSKGVKNYKLDIIDTTESSQGKIVGHCDSGKHKISYTKDTGSEAGH
jgi:hypothetical protein